MHPALVGCVHWVINQVLIGCLNGSLAPGFVNWDESMDSSSKSSNLKSSISKSVTISRHFHGDLQQILLNTLALNTTAVFSANEI